MRDRAGNYVFFVASEQSILKFWKKCFAEQFFAGLIFADFKKIAKNRPPRKKAVLQYVCLILSIDTQNLKPLQLLNV